MATGKKTWTSETWIEGSGTPTYTTLSGTTEEFSAAVDLETNGYEGAQVMVEVDFDATPTDDVEVAVYGSLNGTNFDDVPIHRFIIGNGTDPSQVTFIVRDVAQFQLGFKQTGATDSHDVRASYQAWRWDIA